MYYLVLMIFGGGIQANPAMTTIPHPFATYEECKASAEDWQNGMYSNSHWRCVKIIDKKP